MYEPRKPVPPVKKTRNSALPNATRQRRQPTVAPLQMLAFLPPIRQSPAGSDLAPVSTDTAFTKLGFTQSGSDMALLDRTTRLGLISAWNDSGGGFLHRLIDGHRDIAAWPFELQLGTGLRHDTRSGQVHAKYRWPVFHDAEPGTDAHFNSIIDDELKSVLNGKAGSKFSDFPLDVSFDVWRTRFCELMNGIAVSRRHIIAAYIDSFFSLWRNSNMPGWAIGHCPSLVLDAADIFADFPDAKMLHVLRDPVAGLGSFRQRHPGFALGDYAARWNLVNAAAIEAAAQWSSNMLLLRYENLRDARQQTMTRVLDFLGLAFCESTLQPSWNGRAISETNMGPFGGVAKISAAYDSYLDAGIAPGEKEELLRLTANTMTRYTRAAQRDGAPVRSMPV